MESVNTRIITASADLPLLYEDNFFHSKALFMLCEQIAGYEPYMAICTDGKGRVVSYMLALLNSAKRWFPPFIYRHCHIYGEGFYAVSDYPQEYLFGQMLKALCHKMQLRCLFIEFSMLSHKMFGYKYFKHQGFFPVKWQSIYNSLHSMDPYERLNSKTKRRIIRSEKKGVKVSIVSSFSEVDQFYEVLSKFYYYKPQRYLPPKDFFARLMTSQNGVLLITRYKDHVIGACAMVINGDDCYIWFSAFKRKRYMRLHPDYLTIWFAVSYAYEHGYKHIRFMDVGLPFRKNHYREFLLKFGGRPVSSFRWFKFNLPWINSLFSWIYRD